MDRLEDIEPGHDPLLRRLVCAATIRRAGPVFQRAPAIDSAGPLSVNVVMSPLVAPTTLRRRRRALARSGLPISRRCADS
jgi:hypothetical protein